MDAGVNLSSEGSSRTCRLCAPETPHFRHRGALPSFLVTTFFVLCLPQHGMKFWSLHHKKETSQRDQDELSAESAACVAPKPSRDHLA